MNSPIWPHAQGDDQKCARRAGQQQAHWQHKHGFAHDHQQRQRRHRAEVPPQKERVNQHAHGHKEEDGKNFAKRKQVGPHLAAQARPADDGPGYKRAQRQRDAEQFGGDQR